MQGVTADAPAEVMSQLEPYRVELTGYCYRMLGSAFEAEDAVQETLVRAWRGFDRFEGRARAPIVAVPHRDERLPEHADRKPAPRPPDGPRARPRPPTRPCPPPLPEAAWIEPVPDGRVVPSDGDPAEVAVAQRVRPPRVRGRAPAPAAEAARGAHPARGAALEGGRGRGAARHDGRIGQQRAPARSCHARRQAHEADARPSEPTDEEQRALLARYVDAFERYDMDSLTALLREDATWNMPPYDLWLQTHEDIVAWCLGPGIGCKAHAWCRPWRTARRRSGSTSPAGEPGVLDGLVAPGARDLRGPDQRDHLLPRHRAVLPGLRAAPQPRGLSPRRTGRPAPGRQKSSSSRSSGDAFRQRSSATVPPRARALHGPARRSSRGPD